MSDTLPSNITELFKPTPDVTPNSGITIIDSACLDFKTSANNEALWSFLAKQRPTRVIIGTTDVEALTKNLEKTPIPETVNHDIQHWDVMNFPCVQTIITDKNPELEGFVIPDHYVMAPKIAVERDGFENYIAASVTTRNEERAAAPYVDLEEANEIWSELKRDKSLRGLVDSFKRASTPSNAEIIDGRYQHAMHALYQYFIAYGNNRVTQQSDSLLTINATKATFARVAEQMSAHDDYSTTSDGLPHMSTKQLLSFAHSFVKKEVNALTKPYEPPSRS